MQVREKIEESRCTVFFLLFGFEGPKSRLAKAAGAEPSGQMRDEKSRISKPKVLKTDALGAPLEVEIRSCGAKRVSKSKCIKRHCSRGIFGRSDVVFCGRRKGFCTVPKAGAV